MIHHECADACRHRCEHDGCNDIVEHHDVPFCYWHSHRDGRRMAGYDSRLRPLQLEGYVWYPLYTTGAIFY